jgi:hypothetical protein
MHNELDLPGCATGALLRGPALNSIVLSADFWCYFFDDHITWNEATMNVFPSTFL